jgi:hypothetical protein
MYLRTLSSLGGFSKAALCKALIICALHGFSDYAFAIMSAHREQFSAEEASQLERAFAADTPFTRRIPRFPGRRRLAKLFLALHYICRF